MGQKNAKVDAFIKSEKRWRAEAKLIRQIALDCGLQEELKWGFPCYMHEGRNIALFQSFKDFCALMFFSGHLLKDPKGFMKAPGENSQTARRFEFTNVAEVTKAQSTIKKFLKEAIKLSPEVTAKPKKKTVSMPEIPVEFQEKLNSNKKLKAAFEKLTPGRQRLYLMHFSSAKQSATRVSRIEKSIPKILNGLGLLE